MDALVLERKRKILLVAPLLFVPLLCLLFWAAGGGKGQESNNAKIKKSGINTDIPKSTNEQVLQKDQAYRRMLEDSLNKMRQAQNDNYLFLSNRQSTSATVPAINPSSSYRDNQINNPKKSLNGGASNYDVPNSYEELRKRIASQQTQYQMQQDIATNNLQSPQQELLKKKQELEVLMSQLRTKMSNRTNNETATETNNLNYGAQSAPKPDVKKDSGIYTLQSATGEQSYNRFYGETTSRKNSREQANTFDCVIADDQTVINGSSIKLRLSEDITLSGGVLIPRNTLIYGIAQIQTERINLFINSITYQGSIYPTRLVVYDLDGLLGINAPGGIEQGIANQGKASAVNSGMSPMSNGLFINQSPNVAAQAVSQVSSALIQAGQNVFSRKVVVAKAFLKADYRVLLKQSQ